MGVEWAGEGAWGCSPTREGIDALGRIHSGERRSRWARIAAWLRRVLG